MFRGVGGVPAHAASAAILLATALVLVAVSGDRPAESPGSAEFENGLAALSVRVTPAVAHRLERVRGLEFESIPDPEVVPADHLTALERRQLERRDAAAELPAAEAEARMLGLLDEDEELDAALGATGELAAAAYDPRSDRLYVISDAVAASRPLVEFVLAHELDHALEDEHFGLPSAGPIESDDRALARLALSEGTATSAMVAYARAHLSAADLLASLDALDGGTGAVPEFVVEQLEWAYLGGMRFVDDLRRVADGWQLADYALETRPPASTEQVLHTDKYLDDERPEPVAVESAPLRAAGWRLIDDGDAGEFATRQLLTHGNDAASAARAAAGWGGDRYELWRRDVAPAECAPDCGAELVLVVAWRWDTEHDAREFGDAARAYVEDGLGGEPVAADAWRLGEGTAALGAGGRSATLVLAPDLATADALLGGSAP